MADTWEGVLDSGARVIAWRFSSGAKKVSAAGDLDRQYANHAAPR